MAVTCQPPGGDGTCCFSDTRMVLNVGASAGVSSVLTFVFHSLTLYVPAGTVMVKAPVVASVKVICVSLGIA